MTTLFIILFILALYHFIYEGIFAPSERQRLRYKFFALRDELRSVKLREGHAFNDAVFKELDESINAIIGIIPTFNIIYVVKNAMKQKSDTVLLHQIALKKHAVVSCEIEEVRNIHRELHQALTGTLMINMSGWFPYFLCGGLVYLVFYLFKGAQRKVTTYIQLQIDRVIHSGEIRKLYQAPLEYA